MAQAMLETSPARSGMGSYKVLQQTHLHRLPLMYVMSSFAWNVGGIVLYLSTPTVRCSWMKLMAALILM